MQEIKMERRTNYCFRYTPFSWSYDFVPECDIAVCLITLTFYILIFGQNCISQLKRHRHKVVLIQNDCVNYINEMFLSFIS